MRIAKITAAGVAVLLFFLFVFTLFGGGSYSVPSDMVAVRVGAGPFEASKVKGDCIPSSSRGFFTNDDYRLFPTSEREWDATGQDGSDSGRFKSVTNDNVEMYIPVTVRLTLNTECDTLQTFYTKYARRYGVEFKGSGTFDETGGDYNKAGLTVMRKLVADPTDATLDRIIQAYDWRNVWNDPTTKVEIETRLGEALASDNSLLVQTAKGQYWEGISVIVGKPEPVNEELAKAVAQEQTLVAQAKSEEAQAAADAAKAEAQLAVSKAEAAKKQAEIAAYGGIDGYLRFIAVTNGINPWQPTYLVGGGVTKP